MKNNIFPVIDLHCDLLSYLCHTPHRTPQDAASRCSLLHLHAGNVKVQTLAIYAETAKGSVEEGKRQVETFSELLSRYPENFSKFKLPFEDKSSLVQLLPAFENASSFSSEEESLSTSLTRLEQYIQIIGTPFYISFTWNGENRFGGGCGSSTGLKNDGKHVIEWMSQKNIALDLSHASDRLAEEIINHIDAHSYQVRLIASHSNFRTIMPAERNLPDEIAKEIVRRKGLIGINLFQPFIHKKDPLALVRHVEYALHLGAHDSLCFGADFFDAEDFEDLLKKHHTPSAFFPEYANASKYPIILDKLREALHLSEEQLAKIAYGNALCFLINS